MKLKTKELGLSSSREVIQDQLDAPFKQMSAQLNQLTSSSGASHRKGYALSSNSLK